MGNIPLDIVNLIHQTTFSPYNFLCLVLQERHLLVVYRVVLENQLDDFSGSNLSLMEEILVPSSPLLLKYPKARSNLKR